MGLAVKGLSAIGPFDSQLINFGGDIVKTFCSEKKSVTWPQRSAFEPDVIMQIGMRVPSCEIEVFTPTLCIETIFGGDCLKQCGFAGSIFANKESNGRMKFQPIEVPNRRDAKWISLKSRNRIAFQTHRLDKGSSQS